MKDQSPEPVELLGAKWITDYPGTPAGRIVRGMLVCTNCHQSIYPGGGSDSVSSDCALAVYGTNNPRKPTNFVCPQCRGLLK